MKTNNQTTLLTQSLAFKKELKIERLSSGKFKVIVNEYLQNPEITKCMFTEGFEKIKTCFLILNLEELKIILARIKESITEGTSAEIIKLFYIS